uniref:HTH CENPB-type domain-containing protein n=1 Tax=Plectus sambesii TaxID=2011161 RepID=A0A914WP73_9BILA
MCFSGARWKETSANLNEVVLKWIKEARENRQRVSRRLIKLQAKKIASKLVKEGRMVEDAFIANNGWLEQFMERNGFRLRRVTTQCQKPPAVLAPSLVNFVMFICKKRMERRYPYGQVYAADEMVVWIDTAGRTCVTHKGAKEVAVWSTGHEKLLITVMLCAKDNGAKCLPFVLLPPKRPSFNVAQKFKGKLILSWCGSVWMNQEQTSDFLH